jgi:hypothetical protein
MVGLQLLVGGSLLARATVTVPSITVVEEHLDLAYRLQLARVLC